LIARTFTVGIISNINTRSNELVVAIARLSLEEKALALDTLSEHSTRSDLLSFRAGFTKVWSQNLKGRDQLSDLGTGRRIALKSI
jgi:hypothetical protein